jgi:hypothetical protein
MCRLHVGKQMAWRVSLRPNGEHTAFREGFLKWKKHELFKYSDRELKEADTEEGGKLLSVISEKAREQEIPTEGNSTL